MGLAIVGIVVAGAMTWSLLEYVIHRWLGHDARFRPNLFESEHTRHHGQGDYFAPTGRKVVAALAVGGGLAWLATLLVSASVAVAYVGGLLIAYAAYEIVHRRAHTHPGWGPYGRWVRRHHFAHHFSDPRTNHGVTSPIWDLVFGTYRKPAVITVPVALAMPWLVDEGTGDLRPEFVGDWRLRGRRTPAAG